MPINELEEGKMSTSRGQRSVTYTRIEIDPLGEAVGSGWRVCSQRGSILILMYVTERRSLLVFILPYSGTHRSRPTMARA